MVGCHLIQPRHRAAIFLVAALPVLYVFSRYNYNLFHAIVDGASIVIAAGVFMIIWNVRRILDNDYFLYVGISFLFFAFLDLIHVLGNKNMGVFPEYGNLGPALYIASRYILSLSLLIAPLFIKRKLNSTIVFAAYSLVTFFILLSIFYWQTFPVCIVEGVGLTPFKVISDYIICLVLFGAIVLALINRISFDTRVLWLVESSIILSIATGVAFTLYADPFGIMNAVGHFLQIASFYLVYLAIIETSLTKPQDVLYRKLKQSEEKLAENLKQLDYANGELKQEIAERKRAEEVLRESEERHRSIFENSFDGIILSFPDGRIVAANPEACRMHGYTEAEICRLGRGGIADKSDPRLSKLVEDRYRTGRHQGEVTHIRRDGTRFPCETSSVVFKDKHGRQASVLIIRDITERKRTEDALRQSHEQLEVRVRERTSELESKNRELQEFAFVAAHDLNEPLRKIQTFGDLLKASGSDHLSEIEKDYIARMSASANRMQMLLDALLRYSRIESKGQEFRITPLNDVVQDAAGDLELAIRNAGALVNIGPLPTLPCDPYQMRQLFQNLISNALKYNRPELGTVISIYGEKTEEECRILVEDNGIGFDEKYLDKIFQPFQRLHGMNEYSGLGIGLAICKKIAERHGGTITAKSSPRKGSTFIVTLPRRQGQ